MAFEDAFGVTIPDGEAEKMETPRGVIDFIDRALGPEFRGVCLSQRAFYRIRRGLVEDGVLRASIRPATDLAQVFPRSCRRQRWKRAASALSAAGWPDLERPQSVVRAGIVCVVA